MAWTRVKGNSWPRASAFSGRRRNAIGRACAGAALAVFAAARAAEACTPGSSQLTPRLLAAAPVAVRAVAVVVDLQPAGEGRALARIELRVTHYLKAPATFHWPRSISVSDIVFEDGFNCPPWYDDERVTYFTLRPEEDGGFALTGAFRGLDFRGG